MSEMAQWAREMAANPDDLSVMPKNHMAEGENWLAERKLSSVLHSAPTHVNK